MGQVPNIPHRPPMHWIDGAETGPEGETRAVRTVTAEHPFVREGVLLATAVIEMMAQASACGSAVLAEGEEKAIGRGVLVAIREMTWTGRKVRVGETVRLESRRGRAFGKLTECQCAAWVGGELVVMGRMTFYVELVG